VSLTFSEDSDTTRVYTLSTRETKLISTHVEEENHEITENHDFSSTEQINNDESINTRRESVS
jgi:hypothetical protein